MGPRILEIAGMSAKNAWLTDPVLLDLQELKRIVSRIVRQEVRDAIRDLLPSLVHQEEQRARAHREALASSRQRPTLESLSAQQIQLLQNFYARKHPGVMTPERIAEAMLLDGELKESTGLQWRELRRRVQALRIL